MEERKLVSSKVEIYYLETKSGWFSKNLYSKGVILKIDRINNSYTLFIDLSVNFRVKNKNGNDFEDVSYFEEHFEEFKCVVFDKKFFKKMPPPMGNLKHWFVEFFYSQKKETIKFKVQPSRVDDKQIFAV